MKRHFYISCFVVLGVACGVFVYGLIALYLFGRNIAINEPLFLAILVVGGGIAGYFEGIQWWRIIYIEKAYLKWQQGSKKWKYCVTGVFLALTIALFLFLRNYNTAPAVSDFSINRNLPRMTIESPAFAPNGNIPKIYTCDGERINPPLAFSEIPVGTKSLALTMEDPDVPTNLRPDGVFDHWLVWNMPAGTKEIPQNSKPPGVTGLSGSGSMEYVPPCPPNGEHRYFFTLYALDENIQLSPTSGKKDLLSAMDGHIIDSAQLIGKYNRQN